MFCFVFYAISLGLVCITRLLTCGSRTKNPSLAKNTHYFLKVIPGIALVLVQQCYSKNASKCKICNYMYSVALVSDHRLEYSDSIRINYFQN